MITFLLEPSNLPFAVSIALVVMIGLLEGVGLLLGFAVSGLLDNLVPDLDFDVDADIGDHGAVGEFLTWLRIKEVPVIAIVIAFLTSFGLAGLALQQVTAGLVGWTLPMIIAAPAAFIIAFPGVRWSAGALAKIMPRDETAAVSTRSFVGRTARITLGTARPGSPAQAKFRDQHGTTHYVMVAPDMETDEFPQGSDVLIVRQEGATFYGITAPAQD